MSALYAVAMGALALAPLIGLLAHGRHGDRLGSLCCAVGCVLLAVVGIDAALGGSPPVVNLGAWIGFGHSALRADGLSGIFLALAGVTGAAVALTYAELPAGRKLSVPASTLTLFVAVVIGATNAFLFLLAWETLTVCIYLISSIGGGRTQLRDGYLTGGLTKLGGAALLAAFALLYAHTHSFSIGGWAHAALPAGTRDVVFALLLACFSTKIGVLPLHGGLPAGYRAAPRLGGASLAVALCAGYYGLWRFELAVLGPLPTGCGDALLIVALLTAIAGICYALTQDNLRGFLGYSSAEHAGVALLGRAVALLGEAAHQPELAAAGLIAATMHVVAHNLAKTLALIGADRVALATGKQTLDPLGGLSRSMPFSSCALGVASLTLAAVPPLGAFVSEWLTFEALLQAFRMPTLLSRLLCALAAATLALTAGLGLLAFAKFYGFMFLGYAREKLRSVSEPSHVPLGAAALTLIVLTLGAAAPWEIRILGAGLRPVLHFDLAGTAVTAPLVLGPVFQNFGLLDPTLLCVALLAYTLLGALVARLAGRRRGTRRAPVWVTGSGAPLEQVQYRPSAYSNPMRVILRTPLGYQSSLTKIQATEESPGVGVGGRMGGMPGVVLERHIVLAINHLVYEPATRIALKLATRARRLQSGRLSAYLLYMLAILVIVLALVPILDS